MTTTLIPSWDIIMIRMWVSKLFRYNFTCYILRVRTRKNKGFRLHINVSNRESFFFTRLPGRFKREKFSTRKTPLVPKKYENVT